MRVFDKNMEVDVKMEQTNLSFESWVKPSGEYDQKPFIRKEDKGKEGMIDKAKLVQTKFGTKLFVEIVFGNEVKTLALGKSFSLPYVEKLTMDLSKWKGRKVRIQTVFVNIPQKGMIERPIMEIL